MASSSRLDMGRSRGAARSQLFYARAEDVGRLVSTAGPDRCRVASQELPLSERGLEILYHDKSLKIHVIFTHEGIRRPRVSGTVRA